MRCTGCGKDIPEDATACPNCGYPTHLNRSKMSGDPSFSPILSTEKPSSKTARQFSLGRISKLAAVITGIFVILTTGVLYSFRIPAANRFMQKLLDSYSSGGFIQSIENIPSVIVGGNVPRPRNDTSSANQRATPPSVQPSAGGSRPTNVAISTNQQKTTVGPKTSVPKPATPSVQSMMPSASEPCSQQAADVVLQQNNGDPNGNQESSGENGQITFSGTVKTTLYKSFTGPDGSCLFASYETWTQANGQLYEQVLNIAKTQNWFESVWLQYVQPPESESAMFQQLDSAISAVEQNNTPSPVPASQATLPPGNIAEQSLVALLCHYSDGSMARGSGVIVDPQGYILTAKHMVDPQWTSWAYGAAPTNAALDYCEVGVPPPATLPTAQALQAYGSSISVTQPFPFIATLTFEPSQGQMSDNEYRQLDFAVLKITRPLNNCAAYNFCTLPTTYPYSPVYYAGTPNTTSLNQLLNFGYPYEVMTSSTSANFGTFNLKGTVGRFTQ